MTVTIRHPCAYTEEAKFSERLWGKAANDYMRSIIDLSDEQWDKILAKAELCAWGLEEDSNDDVDVQSESSVDQPISGWAVLVDAEVEERYLEVHVAADEDV